MVGPGNKPPRRHDLDWLRVLVILNLIPFHVAWLMTYIAGFSLIPQDSFSALVLKYYVAFINRWHMPLLFFISGVGVCLALSYRSIGEYIQERLKRLLIPLVFHMLLLHPILAYYWPAYPGEKNLTDYLFNFWPFCLKVIHYSATGGPGWSHMWFVAYLLIFSFLLLPLFLRLKQQSGVNRIAKVAAFFNRKGAIFLLAFPLVIIHATIAVKFPMYQYNLYSDWGFFCYNLTAFIYGFVISLNDRFWHSIDQHCWIALLLGILCSPFVMVMRSEVPTFSAPAFTTEYMLYSILFGFNTWFWMVALLGIARQFLSFRNGFLNYFNAASYPFYIIHLTTMPAIGYYVTLWYMDVVTEFLIISFLSLAITIASYELLIKRIPVMRFAFGMKK
jgi:hypothetical protein